MAKMVADGERRAKSLAKKMWDRLGEEFYRKALEVYGKTEPECASCEWSPGDCENCDV